MSYRFGKGSSKKLLTCDPRLADLCVLALQFSPYDFTIVHGWRGEDVQNALFDSRASMKRWPESKHNAMKYKYEADGKQIVNYEDPKPYSEAIDFAPWVKGSIPWDDTHIFAIIAGCFHAAADDLELMIRYGGDWDSDGSTKDQTLMDWGHVEIIDAAQIKA